MAKDITSIIELAKKALADGGNAPDPNAIEAVPIEKVSEFESLEDYSKTHPPAEPAPEAAGDFAVTPDSSASGMSFDPPPAGDFAAPALDMGGGAAPEFSGGGDIPAFEAPAGVDFSSGSPQGGSDLAGDAPQFGGGELALSSDPSLGASDAGANPSFASAPAEITKATLADFVPPAEPEPRASAPEAPSTPIIPPTPQARLEPRTMENAKTTSSLSALREYSDHAPVGSGAVAEPFSLLIEGFLEPHHKSRLLDLIKAAQLDIREVELEPQFAAGKILIPRVSEYFGIALVQALRDAPARLRLSPSDEVYATDATRTQPEERVDIGDPTHVSTVYSQPPASGASDIPVVAGFTLPGFDDPVAVDAVSAAAVLETTAVEANRTSEYAQLVEALQDELRHKAYHRGASAVMGFTVSLTPLSDSRRYRVLALGTAVRPRNSEAPPRQSNSTATYGASAAPTATPETTAPKGGLLATLASAFGGGGSTPTAPIKEDRFEAGFAADLPDPSSPNLAPSGLDSDLFPVTSHDNVALGRFPSVTPPIAPTPPPNLPVGRSTRVPPPVPAPKDEKTSIGMVREKIRKLARLFGAK